MPRCWQGERASQRRKTRAVIRAVQTLHRSLICGRGHWQSGGQGQPGLKDRAPGTYLICGSRGPGGRVGAAGFMFVPGNPLFVAQLHFDKVEVFRINQNPASPAGILTGVGSH